MSVFPEPADDASPVSTAATVDLNPGERATVEFTPERSSTVFRVPTVATSKRPDTIYEIRMDDRPIWGPAAIPPTDIDDLSVVWRPAQRFEDRLTVVIIDDRSSGGQRTYSIQPTGWEEEM